MKILKENAVILKEIKRLFKSASKIKCAVAFWGEGAQDLFSGSKAKSIEIVCNLLSGGTNPHEIQKIQTKKNVTVKMLNTLHAKVFWTDKGVIIGSANASSNGLSLEGDETDGWEEMSVLIEDPIQIRKVEKWFDEDIWDNAEIINKAVLDKATKIWKSRQKTRISTHKNDSFFDSIKSYLNRDIYIIIDSEFLEKQDETIGNDAGNEIPLLNNNQFTFWRNCSDKNIRGGDAFCFEVRAKSIKYVGFYTILLERHDKKIDEDKFHYGVNKDLEKIGMPENHEKKLIELVKSYIKKEKEKYHSKKFPRKTMSLKEFINSLKHNNQKT